MQQNQNNSTENTDDRTLDPYNALQKVVRLDKKHTNFEFYDKDRNIGFRVSYPAPSFQAPNNQHLLKGFWRHINNYYFKKIQQSEIQRLDYLESVLQPLNQCDVRFVGSPEFWYTVERIFSDQYLNRFKKSDLLDLDCKNWLETLYLIWEKTNIKDKNKNKINEELDKIKKRCFDNLKNYSKIDDKNKQFLKLKGQQNQLKTLLPAQQDNDAISIQIAEFQAALQSQCSQNQLLLERLKDRVRNELNTEQISIIKYHQTQQVQPVQQKTCDIFNEKLFKTKRKIQKMETVDVIKQYLNYCIKNLQKKQVAESISKICDLNKGKTKQQNTFQIHFETGMNLKKTLMNQKQMLQLNSLREYNLFKFYNTSLKTPYSFICQNYYGFRWIYQNRLQPCALKDKNIIEEMKKGKKDFSQTSASKQFDKFDICHHCKLIYPENYLLKCEYKSSKNGAPITPSSYYDPYVSQIIKLQQPKLSNRFMGRKRNCYLGYTKVNEEYTCERKFCKYCMRQNYEDGLDKNGLCPFCQGICFCTRCARNDMIVKLKSMFLLLGGDIQKLQQQSYLDRIATWENQTPVQSARNIARSKTRPPKKPIGGTPARLNEKMRNIRYQLQDLRILCDLVKRRQKQKQKLIEIRCQTFSRKLSALNSGFEFKTLNESSLNTLIEEEQLEQQKKIKLQKKLGRMI